MRTLLCRLRNSSLLYFAVVIPALLIWSSLAFCGEIHVAAQKGDVEKVKALLTDKPDLVFSKDNSGRTALEWAAIMGHKDVAEVLLANNADINAKDNNGLTPLHCAAMKGHKDVTQLLLANNPDINAKDNNGWTPLRWAATNVHKDVAKLLRRHGAKDLPVTTQPGPDADDIHVAAGNGPLKKVQALLTSNPDLVFSKDKDGMTPLHWAAREDQKEVVKLLLANKADVNAKNNSGLTPLHCAAMRGHKETAQLLLANNADINAKDSNGWTPLRFAVAYGYREAAQLLRKYGGQG